MKQYINKAAVVAEIERRKNQFVSQAESFRKIGKEDKESYYAALASNMNSLSCFIDSVKVKEGKEEPVSNDLEEAASQYPSIIWHISPQWKSEVEKVFKAGAQWQKENLWKPADGEDLPEIDREVIAIIQDENDAWITKVVFAHRPPKHWDGKNILTGEVTRYTPKTYDKGEWNMPNVKFWLDLELPKIE